MIDSLEDIFLIQSFKEHQSGILKHFQQMLETWFSPSVFSPVPNMNKSPESTWTYQMLSLLAGETDNIYTYQPPQRHALGKIIHRILPPFEGDAQSGEFKWSYLNHTEELFFQDQQFQWSWYLSFPWSHQMEAWSMSDLQRRFSGLGCLFHPMRDHDSTFYVWGSELKSQHLLSLYQSLAPQLEMQPQIDSLWSQLLEDYPPLKTFIQRYPRIQEFCWSLVDCLKELKLYHEDVFTFIDRTHKPKILDHSRINFVLVFPRWGLYHVSKKDTVQEVYLPVIELSWYLQAKGGQTK